MEILRKQGVSSQNQGESFQMREIFQHWIDRQKVVEIYMAFGSEVLLLGSVSVTN